jgi:hypothetical protein
MPNGYSVTTLSLINNNIKVANKGTTAEKHVCYSEFPTTTWPCDGRDKVYRLARLEQKAFATF